MSRWWSRPIDAAAEQRMAELEVERSSIGIERSGLNPLADLRLLRNYRRLLCKRRARPRSSASRSSPTSTAASPPARCGFRRSPTSAGSARCSSGRARCSRSSPGSIASRSSAPRWSSSRIPTTSHCSSSAAWSATDQARLLPGSGVDLDTVQPVAASRPGPPTFLLIAPAARRQRRARVRRRRRGSLRAEIPDARFQLLGPIDEGNRTAIAQRRARRVGCARAGRLSRRDRRRPARTSRQATRWSCRPIARACRAPCSRRRRWPGH